MSVTPDTSAKGDVKKILLVDDDPIVRQLRSAILAGLGHHVTAAASLEEARLLWAPGRYHLVVVDVKRRVQEAISFCEELKEAGDQLIAFLTPQAIYLPPDSCPDDVIQKEEGPAHFVSEVQQLLATV